MDELTTPNAQPNIDDIKDESLKTAINELTQKVNALNAKLDEINNKVRTEEDIKELIIQTTPTLLELYPTRSEMEKFVGGCVGGINRTVNDFALDMGNKVKQMVDTFAKFSARTEGTLELLRHDLDTTDRQAMHNALEVGIVKGNMSQLLDISTRIDNTLRGGEDGKNGLVARTTAIELALPKFDNSLSLLTAAVEENTRLNKEQLDREQKQEEQRQVFYTNLKQSAWYVASRGLGAVMTTGAIGTALVALGHALIGS